MHKNLLRAEIRARRNQYWDSQGHGKVQGERDALTANFRQALDAIGITPSREHPLAAFYPMEKEPDISGILDSFDPVLLPVLARANPAGLFIPEATSSLAPTRASQPKAAHLSAKPRLLKRPRLSSSPVFQSTRPALALARAVAGTTAHCYIGTHWPL